MLKIFLINNNFSLNIFIINSELTHPSVASPHMSRCIIRYDRCVTSQLSWLSFQICQSGLKWKIPAKLPKFKKIWQENLYISPLCRLPVKKLLFWIRVGPYLKNYFATVSTFYMNLYWMFQNKRLIWIITSKLVYYY